MNNKELIKVIDSFLSTKDPASVDSVALAEKELIFAKTLSALIAEKQLENKDLRQRFKQLDTKYQPKISELFRGKSDDSARVRMLSIMKAALDDISEREPMLGRKDDLRIVSDDVIKAFLSGKEE